MLQHARDLVRLQLNGCMTRNQLIGIDEVLRICAVG
jgi:hypothetical protein